MILVSSCLAGLRTRYDGEAYPVSWVVELVSQGKAIPTCPEQLGGLPTPRPCAIIVDGDGEDVIDGKAKVLTENGEDVTENFLRGAHEVLKIAKLVGAHEAILKNGSPSCGCDKNARLGVTTALLKANGIKIVCVD